MPAKNQSMQMSIIFDLGGVLIDWNPRSLYQKMFNGDEADLDYFLTEVCSLEWNARQDAGRPFSEAIPERIALYPRYAPYIEAYFSRWEEMITGDIPGTVQIMATLRKNGFPLFALSNWSAETYPLVYERFEFLSWFEKVILSGQEKLIKPDPAIYKLLLQRINREAQQCLFIDDSEQNILAASKLGFQTIHFSSPEGLLLELNDRQLILPDSV